MGRLKKEEWRTMNFAYIIGTAGAGKSTLVSRLIPYIQQFNPEINAISVNLDPGVKRLPYIPDVDVRDFIDIDEIIDQYQLGPNGALIAATDLMITSIDDIKDDIEEYNDPEWVFIDTPGQLELFAFRNTGPIIANALGEEKKSVVFLFDTNLCKTPTGFVSTLLLSASVQYRFLGISQINCLSKIDLFDDATVNRVTEWSTNFQKLKDAVDREQEGTIREMNAMLTGVFQNLGSLGGLIPVSSNLPDGIDFLWGTMQRIFSDEESRKI